MLRGGYPEMLRRADPARQRDARDVAALEKLDQLAQQQGTAFIADGFGMLVEQAAAMLELWRGKLPQTAGVLAKLRG